MKMQNFKLMYIIHSLGVGGSEKLISNMAVELKRRGFDCTICCLNSLGEWGKKLKKKGFNIFVLDKKEGVDLNISKKIKAIVEKERPDILHAHHYTPYFYAVLSNFSYHRPKLIFTEHGRFYPDRVRIKRVIFNYFAKFFTDTITGVCDFTKYSLSKYEMFPQNKIRVIYNGIKPEKYEIDIDKHLKKRQLNLNFDDKIIGTIGRLCAIKNHYMLIQAFGRVKKHIKNAKLLIVGDGELRDRLEALSKKMNLTTDIIFLGEREDVPGLMKIFDVFVLSSNSEASSLALLEAMASGLSVVATNVGGNPELMKNNETGILVSRGDYKKFADAIIRILQNPTLQKVMGEKGKERIIEKFSFNRMMDEYIRLYRNLLPEK